MWITQNPPSLSSSLQPPSAKYGGRHTVTMIPGDGIGPELMLHVKSVFRYGDPGPCPSGRVVPCVQPGAPGNSAKRTSEPRCPPVTVHCRVQVRPYQLLWVDSAPLNQSQIRVDSIREEAFACCGPGRLPGRGTGGPRPASLTWLCSRHACVPVDFEEVHVSSRADEEDIRNAIMAIRRNRVALKGKLGARC
jgi:hypothetical protein